MKEKEGLNEEDFMRIDKAYQELFLKGLLERLVDSLERSKRTEVLVHTIDEAAAILKVKRSTIENLIHRTQEL